MRFSFPFEDSHFGFLSINIEVWSAALRGVSCCPHFLRQSEAGVRGMLVSRIQFGPV
jgi:hypothetical protein